MKRNSNRILHVLGSLNRGGAETMVMNYYSIMDLETIQFDFVIHTDPRCDYTDEISHRGGKLYAAPQLKGKNIFQYILYWIDFFRNHDYKVIHCHVRSTAFFILLIAKMNGLTTIAHSHGLSNGTGMAALIKTGMQYPVRYVADYFFSCSEKAGKWMFGNRVMNSPHFFVIKNAIDVEKFRFNAVTRNEYRKKLCVGDETIVVGHCGRLTHVKNHAFLLDVFEKVIGINENVRLLLVGKGELEDSIKKMIDKRKLSRYVTLTGGVCNPEAYLMAMDVFVFPSLFEGFGMAVLEAICSGLPCLISENIPKEVLISESVAVHSLGEGSQKWANELLRMCRKKRNLSGTDEVIQAGFNLNENGEWLEKFYVNLLRRKN